MTPDGARGGVQRLKDIGGFISNTSVPQVSVAIAATSLLSNHGAVVTLSPGALPPA
ncbi:MAG: hypothetical protein HYZ72_13510 [Deltaproteobacteria bacterium]|nr:hypothetical protein [Deltaproteobacteria bacterium]